MIRFQQKSYSEYSAMRLLIVELQKRHRYFDIIQPTALPAVLKGNTIVIENFVISTSLFGKDKYRLYLKIGARAKMPDKVRLPESFSSKKGFLGKSGSVSMKSNFSDTTIPEDLERFFSELSFEEKVFDDNKKKKKPQQNNGGNNGGGGGKTNINVNFSPNFDLSYDVQTLLGETLSYDKTTRSLVMEYPTVQDAINSLDILPFGLNYKLYILDA